MENDIDFDGRTIVMSSNIDHNYLSQDVSNTEENSNIIYIVDHNLTTNNYISNGIMPTNTFEMSNGRNMNDISVMDVGAIQTIDQDVHTIIF